MPVPERRKLVISVDDLDTPAAAPAPQTPPQLPPVQRSAAPAGAPPLPATGDAGARFGNVQVRNLVAAVSGVALGWLATEVTRIPAIAPTTEAGRYAADGLWVAVIGFCFAVVYVGWENIEARSAEGIVLAIKRAGPWGLALGFVSGAIASVIYVAFLKQAIENMFTTDPSGTLYLARVLGWGAFGLGMGLTTGALVRARDKIVNGMIGGLVGGAVAGLIFEWLARNVDSGTFARLLGLLVVGAGIGLAIGVVETLRRQAWFSITGGGMAGKEFILYESETRVGSSPLCEITLIKDPHVQPYHFVISGADRGPARVLTSCEGAVTTVNGAPVAQHQLRHGDLIGAGATTVVYSERNVNQL